MKVKVVHWMLKDPPHPNAVKGENDVWELETSDLAGLLWSLSDSYDIMLHKKDDDWVLWLDDRGRYFRQR